MTLELLLQIFLEFFMELVGGLLTGASLGAASRIPWISRSLNTLHTAIMFFGAGFLIGWPVSGSFLAHLSEAPLFMGLVFLLRRLWLVWRCLR